MEKWDQQHQGLLLQKASVDRLGGFSRAADLHIQVGPLVMIFLVLFHCALFIQRHLCIIIKKCNRLNSPQLSITSDISWINYFRPHGGTLSSVPLYPKQEGLYLFLFVDLGLDRVWDQHAFFFSWSSGLSDTHHTFSISTAQTLLYGGTAVSKAGGRALYSSFWEEDRSSRKYK